MFSYFAPARRATWALLGLLLLGTPALAQRPATDIRPEGSAPPTRPARLQPLFGGLKPGEATTVFGAKQLEAIAGSFASREEASTFFTQKGFEYLLENQPDTATYRFNLAWLLNPRNAGAFRGLAIVSSTQGATDAAISLLAQALTLAPGDATIQADLGTSYLNRYSQGQKKKDLKAGMAMLQQAVASNAANGLAWYQLAQGYYYQEQYPEAWQALHKGRALDITNLDFNLVTELLTKQPDPQGVFK